MSWIRLEKTIECLDYFVTFLKFAKKKEMSTAQIINVWWNGMISIRLRHG
jgi:hypothetical protein